MFFLFFTVRMIIVLIKIFIVEAERHILEFVKIAGVCSGFATLTCARVYRDPGGELYHARACASGLVTANTAPGLPHTSALAGTAPGADTFGAVHLDVRISGVFTGKGTATDVAGERAFKGVRTQMSDQLVAFRERASVPATSATLPQAGVLRATARDVAVQDMSGEHGDGGEWRSGAVFPLAYIMANMNRGMIR